MMIYITQMSEIQDTIKLHIPTLLGLGLSANEYTHLAFLYSKNEALARRVGPLDYESAEKLISKGYLNEDYMLTEQGKDMFRQATKFIDKAFAELYNLYPRKVPDGKGGYRVLRSEGFDTQDAEVCKKKYSKIVAEDVTKHEKIMRALRIELQMRKNNMVYMNNLQTWLNQRAWEKYMDLELNDDSEKVNSI